MSLGGRDVGFVRLDLSGTNDDIFAISIFVEPEFRAVGVGKQMLSLALNSIDVDQDRYQFLAIIGRDNQGSIRLFKSFGFELCMRIDHQFDEYRMTANRKESSALGI
jgi:L-amino acid N-acyltransferase YncA